MENKTTHSIINLYTSNNLNGCEKWVRVEDIKKHNNSLMLFIDAIIDDKDIVKDIRKMNDELSQSDIKPYPFNGNGGYLGSQSSNSLSETDNVAFHELPDTCGDNLDFDNSVSSPQDLRSSNAVVIGDSCGDKNDFIFGGHPLSESPQDLCLCGHPKSEHSLGRLYPCIEACWCKKFRKVE